MAGTCPCHSHILFWEICIGLHKLCKQDMSLRNWIVAKGYDKLEMIHLAKWKILSSGCRYFLQTEYAIRQTRLSEVKILGCIFVAKSSLIWVEMLARLVVKLAPACKRTTCWDFPLRILMTPWMCANSSKHCLQRPISSNLSQSHASW